MSVWGVFFITLTLEFEKQRYKATCLNFCNIILIVCALVIRLKLIEMISWCTFMSKDCSVKTKVKKKISNHLILFTNYVSLKEKIQLIGTYFIKPRNLLHLQFEESQLHHRILRTLGIKVHHSFFSWYYNF